jgi:AcrR family transcriptional regulator
MRGPERRAQILAIASKEFASHGLHGASTETIARQAGITQTYIFRMFGTKKALFLEVVCEAFERVSAAMLKAAGKATGLEALARMGAEYDDLLADRTALLLQLQGFAACGDDEVRDAIRAQLARMWEVVAGSTGLDPVTVKAFLAFGMLLNNGAALEVTSLDEEWARGVRTRIHPGLFEHITADTNQS